MEENSINSIRLNKAISDTGYCSRRAADKIIEEGRVLLNGKIGVLGDKASINDEIVIDGKVLVRESKLIYIAFNKPVGITCTTERDIEGNIIGMIREGKNIRNETGILITNQWKTEIYQNINLEHRLSLYTDYINNFGNIDVEWQLQLEMTVNQYVKANIGTHIIYDDDIKTKEEENGEQVIKGPKVQLKQLLGVGLTYSF